MSKHDKALAKITRKPTPADIKWTEVVVLMAGYGYELLNGTRGSRRKFFHRETKHVISCHEPHPGPHVAKWNIEQIVESLTEQGIIKENQ